MINMKINYYLEIKHRSYFMHEEQQSIRSSQVIQQYLRHTHISQPTIHSYHRYESLLKYIVSYIFDLKMILVDLKSVVYKTVGVQIEHFNQFQRNLDEQFKTLNMLYSSQNSTKYINENSLGSQQINQNLYYTQCSTNIKQKSFDDNCEVEFMMKNCRIAKNDLLKITNLMNGFQRASDSQAFYLCQNCNILYRQSRGYDHKQNIQVQENIKKINTQAKKKRMYKQKKQSNIKPVITTQPLISSRKSDLETDQIGFLTFREISEGQRNDFQQFTENKNKNMITPLGKCTTIMENDELIEVKGHQSQIKNQSSQKQKQIDTVIKTLGKQSSRKQSLGSDDEHSSKIPYHSHYESQGQFLDYGERGLWQESLQLISLMRCELNKQNINQRVISQYPLRQMLSSTDRS